MRLLLIEDIDSKRIEIGNFLSSLFPELTVEVAVSFAGGRKRLLQTPYFELAIFDMTLPQFMSSSAAVYDPTREGEMLLEEIRAWSLPTRALILSGYDYFRNTDGSRVDVAALSVQYQRLFSRSYLGWCRYAIGVDWRSELKRLLEPAVRELRSVRREE